MVGHRGVARHRAPLGHRPFIRATTKIKSSKVAAYKKCAIQCTLQTYNPLYVCTVLGCRFDISLGRDMKSNVRQILDSCCYFVCQNEMFFGGAGELHPVFFTERAS